MDSIKKKEYQTGFTGLFRSKDLRPKGIEYLAAGEKNLYPVKLRRTA
jgi:hypothetical protein